ncbi:hypothetical protein [Fontivita pretiosa]|uniref:hypothetical protein n=1 Tax=Fontivita pretiosa TaxID=2989684 RepID=UPI003D181FD6
MRRRMLIAAAMLSAATVLPTTAARAANVPLYQASFETGLEGWGPSGFSSRPIVVSTSNLVATDGSQSMSVRQTGDGFSWNTKREGNSSNTSDPFYQAWNAMSTLPENEVFVEFDVIYRGDDIPDTATFMNVLVYLNNDNGFRQIPADVALLTGADIAANIDKTFNITIPISQFGGFGDKIPSNANFYQLGWSMNGNWGSGDATVYFDNVRLSVIPEPGVAGLGAVILAAAAAHLRRR